MSTNFCDGGYTLHDVWVSIRSAIVTIEDPVDPLIAEPTGELAESGVWHRGTRAVSFGGSDVTGIRQVGVYRGTAPLMVKTAAGAAAGGCGQLNQGIAYTFTKPCEGSRGVNGAQELGLDTTHLGDGTHALRLVVRDTAGNEAEDALVVKVDNTAPVAPAVGADAAWSSDSSARWTWSGSAEPDRAPVAKVDVERCLGSQGCAVESLPGTDLGGVQSYEHPVPEGESTLRVRETDAAGNVGPWSAAVPVRRDRTAPAVAVDVPGSVVAPGPVSPQIAATDALSGVERTEVEVRVDGSPWRVSTGAETPAAGSTVRFRARARDHAMNVGAWVESRDVVVRRAPEPTVTPGATPAPTASPVPTATPAPRRTVKLRDVVARHARGRLLIRGRLSPAGASGRIEARAGRRRVRATIRRGRFLLATRIARPPRRVTLRYLGDRRHLPATRRVAVRTR